MKYTPILLSCLLSLNAFALEKDLKIEKDIQAQFEELAYSFEEPFIQQDPYGRNPLSALVIFPTDKEAQVELSILSPDKKPSITHLFEEFKTLHQVPVLGLYANKSNQIKLTLRFKDGTKKENTLTIETPPVKKRALFIPESKKDEKTHFHYLHGGVVFDETGALRLSFQPEYEMLYFLNNQFVAEDRNQGLIRYNMLGKKEAVYTYPKDFTSFTHGMSQKPNKNFLVIGSFNNQSALFEGQKAQTQREFVIELDYQTGEMVNKIDLANLLNPDRSVTIKSNTQNYGLNNWCHINSVDYLASDESILVSCRHVGVIKINEKTKSVDFILAPHKGFEKSGRDGKGPALTNKLLTALDNMGEVLPESVQMGTQSYPDFKWPTKTHDARAIGNGIYSVFDNAGNVYDKSVYSTSYSNAQVFQIDEEKKTVQSLWFEPLDFYSESGSSVLYDAPNDTVTVYASVVKDKAQQGLATGKLIRYNLTTHQKMFEATVYRGGETYFYGIMPFSFYTKDIKD